MQADCLALNRARDADRESTDSTRNAAHTIDSRTRAADTDVSTRTVAQQGLCPTCWYMRLNDFCLLHLYPAAQRERHLRCNVAGNV